MESETWHKVMDRAVEEATRLERIPHAEWTSYDITLARDLSRRVLWLSENMGVIA
jgi:hypothetical protein